MANQTNANSAPEKKAMPEVYVGIAGRFRDQIERPDEWAYVRENADGFYINFIEMDHIYKDADLAGLAALFKNPSALIESDMNSDFEKEKSYIDRLHQAGFSVPYSSLNYGWSEERKENLKNYHVPEGKKPRLCFVQQGPWGIHGNIEADWDSDTFPNAQYREWAKQSDGMSTDGPMGLWLADAGNMRAGSFSMVKFAHKIGKTALVMICPYGANVKEYTTADFIRVGRDCVRRHEDNGAEPDIWSVFEYATQIDAVPEQQSGKPYCSTTGMAYYLLHHLRGEPGALKIAAEAAGDPARRTLRLTNASGWCDFAAVLRARLDADGWKAEFRFGGEDITPEVLGGGFCLNKENRLNPGDEKKVELTFTRTSSGRGGKLEIALLPHWGAEPADTCAVPLG